MNYKRIGDKQICKINNYHGNGYNIEYITFDNLDKTGLVNHLFSTKMGGISTGFYSEMNLGFKNGDIYEAVKENYRRISNVIGCEIDDFVCSDQTHTTNIKVVTGRDKGKGVTKDKDYSDIDGLITNVPGVVLCTVYADCVPLYIVDTLNKAIGLSHSGWRGTVKRIGEATLNAMYNEYGTKPEDVIVAIGPSICQKCYEVSKDVAYEYIGEFGDKGDALLKRMENGKFTLNLHYANRLVFEEAGVNPNNISVTDICTSCNSDKLFSHRKTNGKRGNLAAFLMLK